MKALALSLAALALAGAACGGDEDVSTGGPPKARDVRVVPPVVSDGLPPEVDHPVATAVHRLQQAFLEKDYAGVCAEITPAAAKEAGEAAHGRATTCTSDLRRLFDLIREGGGWRHAGAPRVVAVDVDGDAATATVALDRRWKARVPLKRAGGRWRLSGLFGASPERARQFVRSAADADFPPPDDRAVEVRKANGAACPDTSLAEHPMSPMTAGGCRFVISSGMIPLNVMTPFGYFLFARCSITYGVRVDRDGRTWTEEVAAHGKPVACGDVRACYGPSFGLFKPWPGRVYSQPGDDRFLHRVDMCLTTCVGYFVGELAVRFRRDEDGWRGEPVAGGGSSGFRIDSPLPVRGDFDVLRASG